MFYRGKTDLKEILVLKEGGLRIKFLLHRGSKFKRSYGPNINKIILVLVVIEGEKEWRWGVF